MKQKLILFLTALFCTIGAWAEDYTVTYSKSTGSYTATNGAGTWASKWVSTATNPQVTLSVGANNIKVADGNIYSGSNGCTYTLTAQAGYLITGYTITGTANSGAQTLTPVAGGSAVSFATSGTTTLSVSGLSVASTSFQQSTPNNGIVISSFTITLTDDPEFAQWKPSIDGAYLTVGQKAESISAAADAADNSKWYIVTQVRGGETPMYDAGTGSQLRRAATSVTAASLDGTLASESAAYLVRFFSAGDGLYKMQFANGCWIDNALKTTLYQSSAGTYAFYNSNGGSGSYFGWNLNSKSGSRVDNNAAGNTVAFWEEGEVSGTSGNNIWTLYKATVEVPSVTIDVTYAQYVNGVATGTTVTETVLPNSDITIPASLTSGYSTVAYDISTEGTIADADVTIKVNIDKKPGLVEALSELSNSKAYTIKCPRGTYTTNNGNLANTVKSAYSINNFAIISYDSNYYLWSIAESKFVSCDGAALGDIPVAITMASVGNGLFKFQGGGKTMNATTGKTTGAIFDTWTTTDEGNSCAIIAVDDFDATDVLAAIEAYFSTKTLNFAVNVTGTTEAENTRVGKITLALRDETISKYLYAGSEESGLLYTDATFTAKATSYRGYEFTGFSVGGTDYGTSIAAGALSAVADGATLVAKYTASTGNGIVLWDDYTDDNSASYRIPALIRTQSGRLIAFSDYRPGKTDVGLGATSIERRYSDDNGETWSAALRVAQGDWETNTSNVIEWSFGDAAVVADNTPGNSGNDVLMVCCGGNARWSSSTYNADVSQQQQGCVLWRSADGGVTWGSYTYIMPALMQAFVDAGLRASDGSSGIVRAFFSSGKITQSVRKAEGAEYNRIYSALVVNGGDVVVYSDDFGATWAVLGGGIANNGDEAHVVELPDGDLLLVGRNNTNTNTNRYVNVFNYTDFDTAAGQWDTKGQCNNAVTTSCNGDVEAVEAYNAYGEKNTVVVETAPMYGNQRRDVQYYFIALPKATDFHVTDFSTTGYACWTKGMNVSPNWSAYSALLNNGNGTFDILFEECAAGETAGPSGYCIVYQQNQDIKDITNREFFTNKDDALANGVKTTPRPGHFYRIKGSASNWYLTPGTTAEGSLSTTDALDATTIWYYSTEGLVSYSTGLFLDGGNKSMAPVGTRYKAAIEPSTYHEGKYTIKTNDRYSYDRETNHTIDRGSTLNNDVRYAWTIEDVAELPVTVSNLGLATFYSPVALTIPEGVKAYAATLNDTYVHFDEVEAVKAGTGVLVEADAGTYNFPIDSNEADYESDLVGSVATVARTSIAANVYTLQSGPAFKLFDGTNVTGFRSHIETPASAGIKAFDIIFGDDETSINEELRKKNEESEATIYNLAGQRMSKAQKGVNIINGKKLLK